MNNYPRLNEGLCINIESLDKHHHFNVCDAEEQKQALEV